MLTMPPPAEERRVKEGVAKMTGQPLSALLLKWCLPALGLGVIVAVVVVIIQVAN